jgi:hypothetical protein
MHIIEQELDRCSELRFKLLVLATYKTIVSEVVQLLRHRFSEHVTTFEILEDQNGVIQKNGRNQATLFRGSLNDRQDQSAIFVMTYDIAEQVDTVYDTFDCVIHYEWSPKFNDSKIQVSCFVIINKYQRVLFVRSNYTFICYTPW